MGQGLAARRKKISHPQEPTFTTDRYMESNEQIGKIVDTV
jgi:hypothetical protein